MKEIPYKKLVEEYIPWVEENISGSFTEKTTNTHTSELTQSVPIPPQVINLPDVPRILDPDNTPNIRDIDPDAVYVPEHTASGENKLREQGWTEQQYADDPRAGGFVRTVILSGSYAELRKVRVDSEVNSETISTSWSASIGENLKVGNNVGIAGYIQVGETGGLEPGATEKGQEITPSTGAPNSEGLDGLRLVVSDSALIQKQLYVKDSASISGGLDVYGDTRLAHDLYVTGNTEITGNAQIVGDTAITGSLHVSKSIYGSEDLFLTGSAHITGNLGVSGNVQIVGDEAITGSLHVSKSIYGSENFYLTGNAEISKSLAVSGNVSVTESVFIKENLFVTGNASVTGTLNVSGNTNLHSNLSVDHSASVLDLYVTNSARISGNLEVTGSEIVSGNLYVDGDTFLSQNLHVTQNEYVAGDTYLSGNVEISKSLHVSGTLDVTGSVHFSNSLYVSGNEYVSGNVYISGNTEISSGLKVDGRTELENGLYVSGGITSSGDLIVSGDAYITNSIYVGNGGTITGSLLISSSDEYSLVVAGSSSFDDVIVDGTLVVRSGSTFEGDLYVYGNEYVSENVYITGSTYISQNLGVEGDANISGDSAVTGNVVVGGDVWVDQNVDVIGDVTVDGNISSSNSGSFQELYVAGNSYFGQDVVVARNLIVQGTASYLNTDDLYVKDPTIVIACGSISPAAADGAGIEIDGADVSFHYTASRDRMVLNKGLEVEGDQIVSGNQVVYGNQTVEGNVDVTGSLEVREYALFRDNLTVEGSASLGGLEVSGSSEFTGNVNIKGDEAVTGSVHITQNIYGSQDLYLTGSAHITGNLDVNGNEKVNGNVQVGGNESITGSLYVSKSISSSGNFYLSGSSYVTGNSYVVGDEAITGSLHVSGSIYGSENFYLTGDAAISGGLGVSGNVDIQSSHLVMSGASIISGVMNVDNSVNTTNLSASNNTSTKNLYVANSASINVARITQSYVTNEIVTQSLVLTQSVSHSNVYQQIVTQSTVLTQSVSQSYVLSQSVTNQNVTTQSVVSQSVSSSNITNLTAVSESVQNISIVSGNASYFQIDKLVIQSTESAQFGGDIIVDGNVSASKSGSFKDLYVENNATIGHTASVGKLLEVEGDGKGNSITVETGSIYAPKSDLTVQNISSSNIYASGMVTAEYFYGDGRYLTGVTASAASSSTWKQYIDIVAGGTQRFNHPFNTTDVFVQVYQWDNPDFHPTTASVFDSPATRVNDATVKVIDKRIVDVSYDSPLNGYVVISDAGMMITASVDILQCATDIAEYSITNAKTIYRFEHKLGTKNVIVSVYQNTDIKDGRGTIAPVQVFPEQISVADQNHIDIVFGRAPMEGYIVIAKAGHVIKQFDIAGAIEDWNIHYGTTGSWAAKQFTAETLSADCVIAHEYVDTPRIGTRDTGAQYYYERTWGSYLEFADDKIDAYISDSNVESDPVKHVASLDSAGNLKIAGNIETNAVFTTSDIRKKNVEGPVKDALESLENINGVRFTWKDSGEQSIGVVAQEIKAIYPELTKTVVNSEGEEQLVVNYDGLIGVLIQAVKELKHKVDILENENR